MRRYFLAMTLIAGAWSGPAHADECTSKYTLAQIASDLGIMQSALQSLEEDKFKAAGQRLNSGLPCMSAAAPVPVYATAYRLLGAWEYIQGSVEKADGWFLVSEELDPSFSWDVRDFDVGHPLRIRYDELKSKAGIAPTPLPDVSILAPAGSQLLIDGRPLTEAAATVGRPHLIQQVGTDKAVRSSWLIQGNALPSVILVSGDDGVADSGGSISVGEPPPEKEPRKKKKDKDKGKEQATQSEPVSSTPAQALVVKVERSRPPLKTPLLVVSGLGFAAAAATYGFSFSTHSQFEEARTSADINQLRSTTNSLVLASGGIALVAVGVGYWGVLLDGGLGFGFVRNF